MGIMVLDEVQRQAGLACIACGKIIGMRVRYNLRGRDLIELLQASRFTFKCPV
jgi:hypothetical protein